MNMKNKKATAFSHFMLAMPCIYRILSFELLAELYKKTVALTNKILLSYSQVNG